MGRVLRVVLVTGYWLLIIDRPAKTLVTSGNFWVFTKMRKMLRPAAFGVTPGVLWKSLLVGLGDLAVQHADRNTSCTRGLARRVWVALRTKPFRRLAGRLVGMARNPFTYDRDAHLRDESSEFGFGAGMFPDPGIDFSAGGAKSLIPVADPTSDAQLLELAMIKRTDVANPVDVPNPYAAGNTDRYGAAPPLVRERKAPPAAPRPRYARPQMQREW